MSLKVLAKLHPTERLGNVVQLDGRLRIIEYTELPRVLAEERNPEGGLRIWAGSPAIHVFGLSFLKKIGQGEVELPFHIARKAVPYWDESRGLVRPSVTNGLKFERFIFDALPLATRTVALETTRAEEFEPLKNAEGENSPATVQQALSNSYAGWLEKAGVGVLRDAQGNAAVSLEISPLVAMEAEDLIGKVQSGVVVDKPTVWG
jgi:UDP-N-acetylglucosamine/UDP-N-acetylgalactosamine diphosphorylase